MRKLGGTSGRCCTLLQGAAAWRYDLVQGNRQGNAGLPVATTIGGHRLSTLSHERLGSRLHTVWHWPDDPAVQLERSHAVGLCDKSRQSSNKNPPTHTHTDRQRQADTQDTKNT
eukprot:1405402-Amphidinium_carterae.2